MATLNIPRMTTQEALDHLCNSGVQPGSQQHTQLIAVIQVRLAEMQREAARSQERWAMLSALAVSITAVIAVVGLLVALL